MPLTTLDPKTALIVVDLQKGVVSASTAHPVAEVVKQSRALLNAFRSHKLPVVLVNVAGASPGRTERRGPGELPPGFADLIPELNQQPEDYLVTKHARGSFSNTDLDAHLRKLGVTQVVIAGIATGSGVESTARQAYERGFNVTLPVDAMTDVNLETHTYSVTKVFPKLAETGTTQEVIDLLNRTRA